MLIVDVAIVGGTVGVAVWGYRRGLSQEMLLVAAFAIATVIGSRVAPLILDGGLESTYAPAVALPGALILGSLAATVVRHYRVPLRRRVWKLGAARAPAGAALAAGLFLVAAWVAGALLAQVDSLEDDVESSAVLDALTAALPPPGPIVGTDAPPLEPVPVYEGPPPRVPRGDPRVAKDPEVRAAERSVARIAVLGCGDVGGGSGWYAGDGIWVTAAHVAGGADAITVRPRKSTGPTAPASVIWLNTSNDFALLRTSEPRGVAPLPMVAEPRRGTSAAILGYPGGNWAVEPARLGPTLSAVGFLRGSSRPGQVTLFRGRALPGNSGGPIIDTSGRVLGTLFASDRGRTSGIGAANSVVSAAIGRAGPPVDKGPCYERDS